MPASWPPELYDTPAIEWAIERLSAAPREHAGWFFYHLIERDTLIGGGGFKGPPREGAVELGYSILADHQRRGLASEAVAAMVDFAFAHRGVDRVIGETLPELTASIRVLERNGFRLIGEGSEPGVIRYERARPGAHHASHLSSTR